MEFDVSRLVVETVLTRAIGIQGDALDGSGHVWHVLHANDVLPTEAKWTAQTVIDNQNAIDLELFEQSSAAESDQLDDNRRLARVRLFLPPVARGTDIEMTLAVNVEGILRVSAREPSSGHVSSCEARVSVLMEEEIAEGPPDLTFRLEGGESARTPVFGIHLGATHVSVAWEDDFGHVVAVRNDDGAFTTPSAVYFEADSTVAVGAEALRAQWLDPENGCSNIRRHMGSDHMQVFRGQRHTPESVSALILKEVVRGANAEVGENFSKVVITVPAYFGIQEKEATKRAGQIAGLEVVGLVAEPVAALLSVGGGEELETILVYDLGGGTFDTTIMRAEAGRVEVIAVDGDKMLGGADWDDALAQLIAEKFVAQAGLGDDDPLLDAEFDIELLSQAEDAKKSLTKRENATVRCRYQDKVELVAVTRSEFEAATRHLVARTVEISQRVVTAAEAKVPGLKVDRVLLVGGSSKMPMIDAALREQLGWNPARTDFDLAAAQGAAIYGASLHQGDNSGGCSCCEEHFREEGRDE
jgi:molecular chaperone DnaK (HSP70)